MLDGQHLCASRSIRFFEVIRSTTALHEERNGLKHTVSFDEFHNGLVQLNEPDQPDPTQPEFEPWGPDLTQNWVQIGFI